MEWLYSALLSLILTSVLGYFAYRWAKRDIYKTLDTYIDHFADSFKDDIWETVDEFGKQFTEKLMGGFQGLISPVVKKGFSLAGSLGGEAKAVKELQNKLMGNVVDNQFGEYKMLAEQIFGIDVDGLLDEYGAPTVFKAIQGLMGIMQGQGKGFNLGNLLQGKNSPRGNNVPNM